MDENLYYRAVNKDEASHARRDQTHGLEEFAALPSPGEADNVDDAPLKPDIKPPPFLFRDAQGLLRLTKQENMTIAQLVWENELSFMTSDEISEGLLRIWGVMDASIRDGVSSLDERLPGRLKVRRRAPGLYRRLFKGFFPSLNPVSGQSSLGSPHTSPTGPLSITSGSSVPSLAERSNDAEPTPHTPRKRRAPLVVGSFEHELEPVPWKKEVFPGIDFLSC